MAVLARRTFDELRDEHVLRVGRSGDSNYTSRAQRFVEAAYYDLCFTWHHHELDEVSVQASPSWSEPTSEVHLSELSLPSDCWVLVGLFFADASTGAHLGRASYVPFKALIGSAVSAPSDASTSDLPREFSRWGDKLYVERDNMPAVDTVLWYYRFPTAPDFGAAAASPEIDRVWDEHIIDLSVARAQGALWRPELSGITAQAMSEFLAQAPVTPLAAGLLVDDPTINRRQQGPHGGPLG